MKSVQARFNILQKENPNLSDYIVYAKTVRGQKYSPRIISQWFNKLIDKSEYMRSDKELLLNHLLRLSERG